MKQINNLDGVDETEWVLYTVKGMDENKSTFVETRLRELCTCYYTHTLHDHVMVTQGNHRGLDNYPMATITSDLHKIIYQIIQPDGRS